MRIIRTEDTLCQQTLAQLAIFRHWPAMSERERQHKMVGIIALEVRLSRPTTVEIFKNQICRDFTGERDHRHAATRMCRPASEVKAM